MAATRNQGYEDMLLRRGRMIHPASEPRQKISGFQSDGQGMGFDLGSPKAEPLLREDIG